MIVDTSEVTAFAAKLIPVAYCILGKSIKHNLTANLTKHFKIKRFQFFGVYKIGDFVFEFTFIIIGCSF